MAVNRKRGLVEVVDSLGVQGQVGAQVAIPGDTGATAAANAFASEFDRIGARIGEMADRAAAQEGELDGSFAGLDPEFRTRRDGTIRGEAFDRAGLQVAEARLRTELSNQISGAELKYAGSPDKLAAAVDRVGGGVISQAPDELKPKLILLARRQRLATMREAQRRQIATVRAEQASALDEEVQGLIKGAHQRAYALGLDAEASKLVAQDLVDLDAALSRTGIDGKPLVTAKSRADVLAKTRETVINARLIGAFERLETTDARRAFIAQVEEDFAKSDGLAKELDFAGFRSVVGTLQSELRRSEVADRQRLGMIEDRIKSVAERAEKGFSAPLEEMAALRGAMAQIQDPELRRLWLAAEDLLVVQGAARRATPAELDQAILGMRDSMRESGATDEQVARVTLLEKLGDEMRGALKSDPLGWVDRVGLMEVKPLALPPADAPPEQWVAFQSLVQERMVQAETIAGRYEQAPVYLRPDERRALATAMHAGGAQLLQVAQAIKEAAGRTRAPRILAELGAEGAPALAALGGLVASVGPVRVAREAADGLAAARIKGIKLDMPQKDEAGEVVTAELGATFRARPEMRGIITTLANAAYAIRASNSGATEFDGSLYGQIVRELLGEREVGGVIYGGITDQNGFWRPRANVVVPHDVRRDAFGQLVDLIRLEDLPEPPRRAQGTPITEAELAEASLISIGDGRYWVSASADQDLGLLFRDQAGDPYVLDFSTVRPILKRRRPDLFFGGE